MTTTVVLAACGSSDDGGGGAATAEPAKSTTIEGVSLRRDDKLYASLPAKVRDRGSVLVAIDPPLPPYEFFEGSDESKLIGFDPQLGRAIGGVLGVNFDYRHQPFDGIIPALQARKYDLVLSSMTDTAERQAVLDFVDYTRTGLIMIVPKGNPKAVKTKLDFCGEKVAVQKGTTDEVFLNAVSEECTKAGKPAISKMAFPKEASAFLAVKSGKANGSFVDAATGGYAARTFDGGKSIEVVVDPAQPNGYRSNPVGIGLLTGQSALRDAIKAALERVIQTGAYGKLLKRYGMQANAIDQVTLNAGS